MDKLIQLQKDGKDLYPINTKIMIDGNRKAVKYADGRLECSGVILVTDTPVDIVRGALFGSAEILGDEYLVPFKATPDLTYSIQQNSSSNRLIGVHPAFGFGTALKTCNFFLSTTAIIPGYSNVDTAPKIYYKAEGFWK